MISSLKIYDRKSLKFKKLEDIHLNFINFIILFIFQFYQSRCFIFSIIMPIYNAGRYLDEAISSLTNQTIGFENIQLILVNDGSIDQSEEIALSFQKGYPNNIIYIKIEHGGVSKAKNIGMEYATGSYINFFDPDDKWDSMAFNYILLFFEKNKNIDIVVTRIKFFELREDYHPLDYKFDKTRIVNLNQEYNCIQTTGASIIFKSSLTKGKKFDEGLLFYEDVKFINNILLYKQVIGVIREAIYYYRIRADITSNSQNLKNA